MLIITHHVLGERDAAADAEPAVPAIETGFVRVRVWRPTAWRDEMEFTGNFSFIFTSVISLSQCLSDMLDFSGSL